MSEFIWKKNEATVGLRNGPSGEMVKKVLVIYTGGTIGMKWSIESGYKPAQNYLETKIRANPHLFDSEAKIEGRHWQDMLDFKPLSLPPTFEKYRILYTILEYFPLLDSSNLSMDNWAVMAKDVLKYYHLFNGFVILHGTDTMAYTASALSFMFQNLGKPVVMTGSQVPISELRNDARDNVLGALILAGQYVIPEVTVYFNNKLFRGNRVTKMNSSSYNAFSSPNLTPLATIGIDINVEWDAIQRPLKLEKFKVQEDMNRNVGILRIFPGITASAIRSFLQPPMEGIVLQTYGAGNVPDTEAHAEMFEELKSAHQRGVIIVNCTQCSSGFVTDSYTGGIKLRQIGVLPGADMTAEAALTKLSCLLAQKLPKDQTEKLVTENLRGEMTVIDSTQQEFSLRDGNLLQTIATALSVSSSKEIKLLRHTIFPPLLCAAAASGNIECLQSLKQQGGDFNVSDYDGRTPLHVASSWGHLGAVKFLLSHGASVHATDRFNSTPLDDANRFQHNEVIEILVRTGADVRSHSAGNGPTSVVGHSAGNGPTSVVGDEVNDVHSTDSAQGMVAAPL